MSVRSKPSASITWAHEWSRAGHDEQLQVPDSRESQDQALYSCACGCRFEALVSTSVDCPRCGGTQAW